MKLAVGRAIKEAFYKWIGLLLKIRHLLFLPPLFFFYWYTSPFYFFSLIFLSYNPLSVFLQRKKHTPSPVSTISCPLAINLYIGKQWWSRSLISRPFDYYFQWMFFEFLHLVWLMMFGRSLGMMMWCACVFLSILVLDFLLFFFFFAMASILTKKPSHKQYDSMKQDWIDECSVFHLRTFLFFSLSHPKFNQNFKIFSLIAITYIVLALEIALKKQCCDEVWIQTSNKGRYTY